MTPSEIDKSISDSWLSEMERQEFDGEEFDTAECAELPDELDLFRIQAEADPNFDESYVDWYDFICEKEIWLPLEQSCSDGTLLPLEMRFGRVKTCPEKLRRPIWEFFSRCPVHFQQYLALRFYVIVRIERARRTGSPEWRPIALSDDPPEAY